MEKRAANEAQREVKPLKQTVSGKDWVTVVKFGLFPIAVYSSGTVYDRADSFSPKSGHDEKEADAEQGGVENDA